jgi:hypothetical protein
MRQAICGHVVTFAVANRGIMDHGIEAAECIDPRGDFFRAGDGIEVALDDGFGTGQSTLCVSGPRTVTGMKDHLMTLLDEQFACHQAKAG